MFYICYLYLIQQLSSVLCCESAITMTHLLVPTDGGEASYKTQTTAQLHAQIENWYLVWVVFINTMTIPQDSH